MTQCYQHINNTPVNTEVLWGGGLWWGVMGRGPSKLLFAFDQLNQQRASSHIAFHPTTDSEKVIVGPEYGHL